MALSVHPALRDLIHYLRSFSTVLFILDVKVGDILRKFEKKKFFTFKWKCLIALPVPQKSRDMIRSHRHFSTVLLILDVKVGDIF